MGGKESKNKRLPRCDKENQRHQLKPLFRCMFEGNCERRPILCQNCSFQSPTNERIRLCKLCFIGAKNSLTENKVELSAGDL